MKLFKRKDKKRDPIFDKGIERIEVHIVLPMSTTFGNYSVHVQVGGSFSTLSRIFLDDLEPSNRFSGMTAKESHEKRLSEREGWGYPLRDNREIENAEDGMIAANSYIRELGKTRDLRFLAQPVYRIMTFEEHNWDIVTKERARKIAREYGRKKVVDAQFFTGKVECNRDVSVAWQETNVDKGSGLLVGDVIEIEKNGTYMPLVKVVEARHKTGIGVDVSGVPGFDGFVNASDLEAQGFRIVSVRRMVATTIPFSMTAFNERGKPEHRALYEEWDAAKKCIFGAEQYITNGGIMWDQSEVDAYDAQKERLDAAEEALLRAWDD